MKPINRKLIWPVLSLILLSLPAYAREKSFDPSVLSAEGKTAYEELLKVGTFGIGPVDGLKAMSVGGESLDILIGEDGAVSALKDLVHNADNEGALFALLGLRTLKCKCMDEQVANFNKRTYSERRPISSLQGIR